MNKYLFLPIILLCFFCCSMPNTYANDNPIMKRSVSLSYHLLQHQNDFGVGMSIASPFILDDVNLAFRLRTSLMWNEGTYNMSVDGGRTGWRAYGALQFGASSYTIALAPGVRLYGEGGLVVLLPSGEFSSESTVLGGYGIFGFEVFSSPGFAYFIEIGGMGTGATADKLPNQPIYSNGLTVSGGFRIHL